MNGLVPTIDEYLRTSYEYDREFVRGEVIERPLPVLAHSKAQAEVAFRLHEQDGFFTAIGLRLRLAKDVIRVADVAVFYPDEPSEQVPSTPPLIVVEIVAPGDKFCTVTGKLAEYYAWSVPNVWLVDPQTKKLYVYGGGLREVQAFELASPAVRLTAGEIFD